MFFFTFAVYLELFERVRSCFGVGYTLRCRIRVLNYNYAAATRCVSIDTQGVDRTDYELYYYYLQHLFIHPANSQPRASQRNPRSIVTTTGGPQRLLACCKPPTPPHIN